MTKESNRSGFSTIFIVFAFLIGGLLGFFLNVIFKNVNVDAGRNTFEVKEVAKNTLQNKAIKGFILNVQGKIAVINGKTIIVEEGGDQITLLTDDRTQIARNVAASKEASASGASYRQEVLSISDLKIGNDVGASVQSNPAGSLIATDITVL